MKNPDAFQMLERRNGTLIGYNVVSFNVLTYRLYWHDQSRPKFGGYGYDDVVPHTFYNTATLA